MKIVHINGYSLAENPHYDNVVSRSGAELKGKFGDWERVCWGDPANGLLGRIPWALRLANVIRADRIVWSTGCSRLGKGEWEADVMYSLAHDAYDRLVKDFPDHFGTGWFKTKSAYREYLRRTRVSDIESDRTYSSLQWLAKYIRTTIREYEPTLVYSVASANHSARVERDLNVVFGFGTDLPVDPYFAGVFASASGAMTSYGGSTIHQTLVRDLGN